MSRAPIIIFLAVTIASVCVIAGDTSKLKHIVNSFNKMDEYLLRKLGSDKLVGELKVSETVLFEKLQKVVQQSSLTKDKYYQEALEKLIALADLKDADKCSDNSLELLEYCDKGTEGKARANWNRETARPIDKLVHRLFMEHARYCENIYPERLVEIFEKVDKKIIDDVDPLLLDIIGERLDRLDQEELAKEHPTYLYENMVNPSRFTEGELEMIVREINRRFEAEKTGEIPATPVYNKLKVPCERLVQALKSNLFGPAAFDQELTKPSPRTKDELEYYHALTGYNTCAMIAKMFSSRN